MLFFLSTFLRYTHPIQLIMPCPGYIPGRLTLLYEGKWRRRRSGEEGKLRGAERSRRRGNCGQDVKDKKREKIKIKIEHLKSIVS